MKTVIILGDGMSDHPVKALGGKTPLMVAENTDSHRTAFTVSIDFIHGTTTGISAADAARSQCAACASRSAASLPRS